MKRILLLGVLVIFGALALQAESPWATHVDVGVKLQDVPGEDSEDEDEKLEDMTLLPVILEKGSLKVAVAFDGLLDLEDVQKAYNQWFANAAAAIRRQKREEEFEDVLETLDKGVTIEPVKYLSDDPRDLQVSFEPDEETIAKVCEENQLVACRQYGPGIPQKVFVIRDHYSDLLHELGHTLGIADAYKEGYEANASDGFRSRKWEKNSVMSDGEDAQLTDDDADALINVIDQMRYYIAKLDERMSSRVRYGWKSLHQKNGKPVDCYAWGTSVKFLLAEYRKKATNCASFLPKKEASRATRSKKHNGSGRDRRSHRR